MAANHFHFVQRNASAEMLGFHAQDFATVVEHVTVNLFFQFMCCYIILFLGRVDFSK